MSEPSLRVVVSEPTDALTPDRQHVSVDPGRYKIAPLENSVRGGMQVIALETEDGRRLPELVTRCHEGRTRFGDALSVERAPAWSDEAYHAACVYLEAWR